MKKAYRQLSLLYHPDRGGDPVKFMKITKAHQALTDEEARKNWEEYGNPDGPGGSHKLAFCRFEHQLLVVGRYNWTRSILIFSHSFWNRATEVDC